MDQITITTWLWGNRYSLSDVKKLHAGFKRHLRQPFKFLCFTDVFRDRIGDIQFAPFPDLYLTNIKGCFARLRMFDPVFQSWNGLEGRIVCSDLDTIITGPLDPLFDRPEPFLILLGANAANPCPYTGALMMLRSGAYPEIWKDFTLEKARTVPFYEFPDDQGWIWHKIPDASGWKAGQNGVYAFFKPGWPGGKGNTNLPYDARIVTFIGGNKPKMWKHLPWVQKHWIE